MTKKTSSESDFFNGPSLADLVAARSVKRGDGVQAHLVTGDLAPVDAEEVDSFAQVQIRRRDKPVF